MARMGKPYAGDPVGVAAGFKPMANFSTDSATTRIAAHAAGSPCLAFSATRHNSPLSIRRGPAKAVQRKVGWIMGSSVAALGA